MSITINHYIIEEKKFNFHDKLSNSEKQYSCNCTNAHICTVRSIDRTKCTVYH